MPPSAQAWPGLCSAALSALPCGAIVACPLAKHCGCWDHSCLCISFSACRPAAGAAAHKHILSSAMHKGLQKHCCCVAQISLCLTSKFYVFYEWRCIKEQEAHPQRQSQSSRLEEERSSVPHWQMAAFQSCNQSEQQLNDLPQYLVAQLLLCSHFPGQGMLRTSLTTFRNTLLHSSYCALTFLGKGC